MDEVLLAHIRNDDGGKMTQSLKAHCEKTAQYAGEALVNMDLYHIAYLSGLLHDMGKATRKFNDYLKRASSGEKVIVGSVNHTFAGVVYMMEKYDTNEMNVTRRLTCELVSYVIGAHHGLFDCMDLNHKSGFEYRLHKNRQEICYEEAKSNYFLQVCDETRVEELFEKAVEEIKCFIDRIKRKGIRKTREFHMTVGFLARLILSAVIEGDRRDTTEFMSGKSAVQDQKDEEFWNRQLIYMEKKIAGFTKENTMNRVRSYISDECVRAAEKPAGVYKISVPTGAGKTLSTLRYALHHAKIYNKKRIIFIIPLLSVLEQNAQVIRDHIADKELLLEHHSNIVQEKKNPEELDYYELLKESWNTPFVISTMVQLMNILFKHPTSIIRRMQALSDSVIVIDEVQSVPPKLIYLFNYAMNFLSCFCNTTIILSSATQPCFEQLEVPLRLADQADMIMLDKEQLNVFQRAAVEVRVTPYGMSLDELAQFCIEILEKQDSLLVICNTKSEARHLYVQLKTFLPACTNLLFHLSTAMCQKHRKDTLEEIYDSLEKLQKGCRDKKIICISTQLVEAGIDFSFQAVVRIMAGADNLAQSVGRCNRSNEYGPGCRTYLVNLKKEELSKLKEIRYAQKSTFKVLQKVKDNEYGENTDLLSEELIRDYYATFLNYDDIKKDMYYPFKKDGIQRQMVELLLENTGKQVLEQPFLTVGKEFQVFEDNTIDVLVPYQDGAEIISNLCSERARFDLQYLKEQIERAKPYTISIYEEQKKQLEEGILHKYEGERIWALDAQAYDHKIGLYTEEKEMKNLFY